METVKITKVFISDKSKDGKAFITKKGKPFWKVGILTDKYPDSWISALAFEADDAEMQLQERQEVKIIIETNGQYKNFKLPSRLDQLEERVVKLEQLVALKNSGLIDDAPPITDADLPF